MLVDPLLQGAPTLAMMRPSILLFVYVRHAIVAAERDTVPLRYLCIWRDMQPVAHDSSPDSPHDWCWEAAIINSAQQSGGDSAEREPGLGATTGRCGMELVSQDKQKVGLVQQRR